MFSFASPPSRPSRGRTLGLLLVFSVIGLLSTPALAAQQSVLTGIVVEDGTRQPLGAVDLRVLDANDEPIAVTLSDEDGAFRLEVPDPGSYTLSVRRIGYEAIRAPDLEIDPEEAIELEITLATAAIALEPVRVISSRTLIPGRIREFRNRAEMNQRLGRGRIFTRTQMERFGPMSAQEVLDGYMRVPNCRPIVLLDGLPVEGRLVGIRAEDLEGIESYRGVTQIPPEYYRYGMCGLTMMWSRADVPGRPFTLRRALVAGALVAIFGLLMR